MNLENKNELEMNVITNDTKNELKNDRCNDIWIRNCPQCYKQLIYNRKGNRDRHERKRSVCSTCCRVGKPTWASLNKTKASQASTGRKHTLTSLQKIIDARRNQYPPSKGKIRSEESKEKMRLSVIRRFERDGIIRSYNPKACDFIDKLNTKFGCHLQHAKNGGEIQMCGFFVDGYDKEKNIIFEYDESHHYKSDGSLKNKDNNRQMLLINRVKPRRFIRYNEKIQKLYDV